MFTNLNLWTASHGLPIQTLPCGPGEEACLIFHGLCTGCCLVHSNLKSLALKKSPGASLFDVVLVTFLTARQQQGRVYCDSQLEGVAHHGGEGMAAGV